MPDSDEQVPDSLGEYDGMPRSEIPLFEKTKGTEAFKEQVYISAIRHYSKALMALNILAKDE